MDAEAQRQLVELHAQVCRALADPKRLLIIEVLRSGPRTVGQIADELSSSQPNVSQHLAVLRERQIVESERDGTRVVYRLNGDLVTTALDLLRQHARDAVLRQGRLLEGSGDMPADLAV